MTPTRGARWWWAPSALLLGIVGWRAAAHPLLVGDSHGLVIGSKRVVDCLRHGQFTWCDRRPDGLIGGPSPTGFRQGAVGQFALLQYLVAVPLRALGLGAIPTLRALILIDFGALLVALALVWRLARRLGPGLVAWGPVLALALIVSPLLWYSTVPSAEVLAVALMLGVVAGVIEDWPPVVLGLLVALACVSKETNPLFVVALGGTRVPRPARGGAHPRPAAGRRRPGADRRTGRIARERGVQRVPLRLAEQPDLPPPALRAPRALLRDPHVGRAARVAERGPPLVLARRRGRARDRRVRLAAAATCRRLAQPGAVGGARRARRGGGRAGPVVLAVRLDRLGIRA